MAKLKKDPTIAEWHGAPNQIRRLIDAIMPSADEAHAEANASPSTEALVEYIVRVNIIYANVEPVLAGDRRQQLRAYLHRINDVRWKMPRQVDKQFYFNILKSVEWLDSQLRLALQDKKLLFKVGRDKQYSAPNSVRDASKYMSPEKLNEMAQKFPSLASYLEMEGQESGEQFEATQKNDGAVEGDVAPSGTEDISEDSVEFEDTDQSEEGSTDHDE